MRTDEFKNSGSGYSKHVLERYYPKYSPLRYKMPRRGAQPPKYWNNRQKAFRKIELALLAFNIAASAALIAFIVLMVLP
ncbi:MAG: hypothetical protein QXR58_02210 [Candidatus Micrarchaeaceae archaeon]